MNYIKQDLLERLLGLQDELLSEDAVCKSGLWKIIEDTVRYIQNMPCTYDKKTVVQAIACHACQKCTKDFDIKRKRCKKQYEDAEFLYEQMILDEHDEEDAEKTFDDVHKTKEDMEALFTSLAMDFVPESFSELVENMPQMSAKEMQVWGNSQIRNRKARLEHSNTKVMPFKFPMLWIRDKADGSEHLYGTNTHDSLWIDEKGALQYMNRQNNDGTGIGGGYEFVDHQSRECQDSILEYFFDSHSVG